MLAMDRRSRVFQAALTVREESVRGPGGGIWSVRFDDGHEASVCVALLRERWHVPIRILCLWGNYYKVPSPLLSPLPSPP